MALRPNATGPRLRERIRDCTERRTGSPVAHPIATVSGVASTTPGMITWFDRQTTVAMITTKSVQIAPNPGNREPIITEPEPGSFGNAVGLRNAGAEKTVAQLSSIREGAKLQALLSVSISGATAGEFATLATRFASVADLLELNYSCPHSTAGYGADIGRDETAITEITAAVVDAVGAVPILVKLTPNVPDVARMAVIAIAAGAAGVSAINTVGPVVYRHPISGTSILTNPPDGRGGRSGTWIRKDALKAVGAIRSAIGPDPVIVGMGGVAERPHVEAMVAAGADVVGVGSALARVHQRDWARYLSALSRGGGRSDFRHAEPTSDAGMTLLPHTVAARRELGAGLFELDIRPPFWSKPGQSVFLWLPEVGEKPFAPACSTSTATTFLVSRRGPMTNALGALVAGDAIFVRGPYGDPWTPPDNPPGMGSTFLLVAAGSGAAILPMAAAAVAAAGFTVAALVGVREPMATGAVSSAIVGRGSLEVVPDEGVLGRALDRIPALRDIAEATSNPLNAAWICGPEPFMRTAAERLVAEGVCPSRIYVSLERSMRCGVGMCGECHQDGRLTCQFGTVVTEADLK